MYFIRKNNKALNDKNETGAIKMLI